MVKREIPSDEKQTQEKKNEIPAYAKYVISGLSGCGSTAVCHPIDVVKNRMQLSGEGGAVRAHKTSLHAVINITKTEGLTSFYKGFSANIVRQILSTSVRLGTYQVGIEKFAQAGITGLPGQIYSGLISGLLAAFLATPSDVALIRMTADNRLPPAERRNYKHVFDAFGRIYKEEGVQGLWTGITPTILRGVTGNVTQLVSYVQAKHFLLDNNYMQDNVMCHLVSSLASGLVYAFITVPLDVAKTRIQTMKNVNGKPEYSGIGDVYVKIFQKEGVLALWKGFGPYYFKIAPNTTLLFLINESLLKGYKKYVLQNTNAKGGF